ncbi:MAG: thioredoxin family protein [Cyanobacteriota bacterium]
MIKYLTQFILIAAVSFALILCSPLAANAQDQKKPVGDVIMVYASWSVVSRQLRPVADEITKALNFTYIELDVDSANTPAKLREYGLSIPQEIPYVAIIKNGKVVFQKTYPNANADMLKEDLTEELSNYI